MILGTGIRKERCNTIERNVFTPLPHQASVRDYFMKSKYRGLLLFHKLGSGKTCTSIIIADAMLKANMVKKVFVCTPGALRKNFVFEYCKKCGIKPKYLHEKYTFITYNTNIFEAVKRIDFNNSLVIIDEVHNLINGVKNISKNPTALYNQIKESNARVLVLSATVIFNSAIEWCLLGNLLKDDVFPDVVNKERSVLFALEISREITRDKLEGIVSYFPGYTSDFPEVIEHEPIKVPMTFLQGQKFEDTFLKENKRIAIGEPKPQEYKKDPKAARLKKLLYIMAMKRILSRMVSNVHYTPINEILGINCTKEQEERIYAESLNLVEEKQGDLPVDMEFMIYDEGDEEPLAVLKDILNKATDPKVKRSYLLKKMEERGIEISKDELNDLIKKIQEEEIKKCILVPDKLAKNGGWIDHEIVLNKFLLSVSPKFVAIIVNILKYPNSKHVVFSYYLNRGGILMIKNLLQMCGINSKVYHGELPPERRVSIIDKFNSEANRDGKEIQVLLCTEAGIEGITFKEVEHVHFVETNTVSNKTLQAIGRAVRYQSHIKLPKERQKVNIWRYFSVKIGLEEETNLISNYKFFEDNSLAKFVDTYDDYYQCLIKGEYFNKLNQVPGTVSYELSIDEILDNSNKQKLIQYEELYDNLKKYSIESLGLA